MPKATPSKAELPKKPEKPRKTHEKKVNLESLRSLKPFKHQNTARKTALLSVLRKQAIFKTLLAKPRFQTTTSPLRHLYVTLTSLTSLKN